MTNTSKELREILDTNVKVYLASFETANDIEMLNILRGANVAIAEQLETLFTQQLNKAVVEARIDELMPIDNINRRLGDDFGEIDAQEEIEKYVDSRLATLKQQLNK